MLDAISAIPSDILRLGHIIKRVEIEGVAKIKDGLILQLGCLKLQQQFRKQLLELPSPTDTRTPDNTGEPKFDQGTWQPSSSFTSQVNTHKTLFTQFIACLRKQRFSYLRNPTTLQ
ncbi:conserved hypothetical protein [Ricinus communis]|uniref:Uncharacterized protein n=1 Tax=Ricinus communis TaxID=3988 RepID=B9RJZ1_RICCO|nr:conserved hypothetical protein [Ricinus communis]